MKESWESWGNHSILSSIRPLAVLPTTPGLEFLHAALLNAAQNPLSRSLLKIDALMLALLQEIGGQGKANQINSRHEKLKDHQLAALDQARLISPVIAFSILTSFLMATWRRCLILRIWSGSLKASAFPTSCVCSMFMSKKKGIGIKRRRTSQRIRRQARPAANSRRRSRRASASNYSPTAKRCGAPILQQKENGNETSFLAAMLLLLPKGSTTVFQTS